MLLRERLNDISASVSFLLANISDAMCKHPCIDPEILDFYQKLKSCKFAPVGEEKELDSELAIRLASFQNSIKNLNFSLYKNYPIRRQDIEYKTTEELGQVIDQAQINYFHALRSINKKIAFAELILGKLHLRSAPISVNLDPNINCNYRCKTCHHGNGIAEIEKMQYFPISSISKLEGLLKRVEALHLFGAGEPTLSPSLVSLCQIIERYHVNSSILTNGSTLSKTDAPLHVFNQIAISYDGDNARTFEAIRANSSFDKINARIKAFKEDFPASNLVLNMTVNRANLDEIEGVINIAARLGVSTVILNKMGEYYSQQKGMELCNKDIPKIKEALTNAKNLGQSLGVVIVISISTELLREDNVDLTKEEMLSNLESYQTPTLRAAEATIEEAIDHCRIALLGISQLYSGVNATKENEYEGDFLQSYEWLNGYLSALEEEIRTLGGQEITLPYCFSPWLRMLVSANAKVTPCCVMSENMGNIEHQKGVENVWRGDSYVKLRRGLSADTNPNASPELMHPKCRNCQFIERRVYGDEVIEYAKGLGVTFKSNQNLGFRSKD